MILYHLTDEEASLSSSNVETYCMSTLNIENTEEEYTVLNMTTFNGRDLDVIHIDKTIAKGIRCIRISDTNTFITIFYISAKNTSLPRKKI